MSGQEVRRHQMSRAEECSAHLSGKKLRLALGGKDEQMPVILKLCQVGMKRPLDTVSKLSGFIDGEVEAQRVTGSRPPSKQGAEQDLK